MMIDNDVYFLDKLRGWNINETISGILPYAWGTITNFIIKSKLHGERITLWGKMMQPDVILETASDCDMVWMP